MLEDEDDMELNREGIWCIRRIKDGVHHRFEGEKIEELPQIMKRASFEPYRDKIYKKLVKAENQCGWTELSAKEILNIVVSSLKD